MRKVLLLGTNKLDDESIKKINESKGFVPIKSLGYGETFYGGRVKNVAKTSVKGVYLLIGKEGVIDIAIESLDCLTKSQIAFLIKLKNSEQVINLDSIKKDDLILLYKKLHHII